jgi:glycosyltransferase involved in cell wall biosynthesis
MNSVIGIGINVWNGEQHIKKTINSIIKQTYKNFTMYILDNKSTDKTIDIIKKIKRKKKIKLIIDYKRRDIPSAQKILVNKYLSKHKYSMIVNDDDIYHPNFIKECLYKIKKDELDLVYCNYLLTNNGKKFNIKNYPLFTNTNSRFLNTIYFLIFRNVVPVFFGLYKTSSLKKAFKFYRPILKSNANYDNQFILHFLTNFRVGYINKKYFYYSGKDRSSNVQWRSLIFILIHQYIFLKTFLNDFLKNSNFSIYQKIIVTTVSVIIFFQKIISYNIRIVIKKLFN